MSEAALDALTIGEAKAEQTRAALESTLGPAAPQHLRVAMVVLLTSLIHDVNLVRGLVGEPEEVLSAHVWAAAWRSRRSRVLGVTSGPQWLLRDRDSIYDDQVPRRIASLGITEVVSSPLSPRQDPYVERVIGSIRRECLDHVIVLNQRHLCRILRAYFAYYHRSRTHLGLSKDAPDGRPACAASGPLIVTAEVGGLHHRYDRRAA